MICALAAQAVRRFGLQQFFDEILALGFYFHVFWPINLALKDQWEDCCDVRAREGHLACDHLEDHAAERPEVRCACRLLILDHFRRQVVDSANECSSALLRQLLRFLHQVVDETLAVLVVCLLLYFFIF